MKNKPKLLELTAVLTCGVVNGCRMRVRPVIKPPWAEKRPVQDVGPPELSLSPEQDSTGLEDGAETKSVLSKEQLKALRNQQGWPHFKDVFMLSSVDREDVETLKVQVSR